MLGLISEINDMLQDVQGKKSVEMKRRIIRSVGALIEQVGQPISNVSPQVCLFQLSSILSSTLKPLDNGNVSNNGCHS